MAYYTARGLFPANVSYGVSAAIQSSAGVVDSLESGYICAEDKYEYERDDVTQGMLDALAGRGDAADPELVQYAQEHPGDGHIAQSGSRSQIFENFTSRKG